MTSIPRPPLPAGYVVRPATVDDVTGIARVHVDSWRTTYRGIVADDYLASLSYERSAARNREFMLRADAPPHVFVVTAPDGGIVGFAMGGVVRTGEPFEGELYGIYLLEDEQGKGLGGALVTAMAQALAADGHRSLVVWVLADNPSRRFYERLGGQCHRTQMITIGGRELPEVAYGWSDITVFLRD